MTCSNGQFAQPLCKLWKKDVIDQVLSKYDIAKRSQSEYLLTRAITDALPSYQTLSQHTQSDILVGFKFVGILADPELVRSRFPRNTSMLRHNAATLIQYSIFPYFHPISIPSHIQQRVSLSSISSPRIPGDKRRKS